jgi:hypothetical protein
MLSASFWPPPYCKYHGFCARRAQGGDDGESRDRNQDEGGARHDHGLSPGLARPIEHTARPAIPSPTGTDVERVMAGKLDPIEQWAHLARAAV